MSVQTEIKTTEEKLADSFIVKHYIRHGDNLILEELHIAELVGEVCAVAWLE